MKVFKRYAVFMATAILLLTLICPFAVSAQIAAGQQQGMVTVSLKLVRNDIAKELNVRANQLPLRVQAPVGVAAQVCNMDANELRQKLQKGRAACQAKTTNQDLNNIVMRQMVPPQKQ